MPARPGVPKPGPAKLRPGAGLDEWLEEAKQCHYLPESVMKELCEIVKEVLMEGMLRRCEIAHLLYLPNTCVPQKATSSPSLPPLPYAATSTANFTIYSNYFVSVAACPASPPSTPR